MTVGCSSQTILQNVHGRDDDGDNHKSTAHDVSLVVDALQRISHCRWTSVDPPPCCYGRRGTRVERLTWRTEQAALRSNSCRGMKTGITPKAGPCLCTVHGHAGSNAPGRKSRVQIVVVTLGSASKGVRWREHERPALGSRHTPQSDVNYVNE